MPRLPDPQEPDNAARPATRDRLALIVETQRDVAMAGDDIGPILGLIAQRAMELTHADGAMVSLVVGAHLVVAAAVGVASPTYGSQRRVADSIAEHAFRTRSALLIRDTETDPRINTELRALVGDRSLITVPLLNGDTPVASLNVMRLSETDRLGEEELQTLELVAVVLSAAVSRVAEAEAKDAQAKALARFEATYASALLAMVMMTPGGRIVDANPAAHRLLGVADGHLVGRASAEFVPHADRDAINRVFGAMLTSERETLRIEQRLVKTGGEIVWVDATMSVLSVFEGQTFAIALMQDISERKAAQDALVAQSQLNEYQALHDDLTDLPNRALFRDRVGQAVQTARRLGGSVGLLVMDLDGFKEINDTLGHAAGDEVLVELSRRLKGVMLRGSDTAARLGGDEFAVLLPEVTELDAVLKVIAKVRAAFDLPITARGTEVGIAVSIGAALFPADGDTVDALVHAADLAMYHAKRTMAPHAFHRDLAA